LNLNWTILRYFFSFLLIVDILISLTIDIIERIKKQKYIGKYKRKIILVVDLLIVFCVVIFLAVISWNDGVFQFLFFNMN
jgi:hypothetical protein